MEIQRDKYLRLLIEGMGNGLIKIIIVRRNIEPYYDEDGVRIIGLMDFLLEKEPLL